MGDIIKFPSRGVTCKITFSDEFYGVLETIAKNKGITLGEALSTAIADYKFFCDKVAGGSRILVERGRLFKRKKEVIIP